MRRVLAGVASAAAALGVAAFATRDAWLPFARLRLGTPIEVELIGAGDEPRKILEYRFEAPPRPFTLLTQQGIGKVRGVLQAEEEYGPPLALHLVPESNAVRFGVARVVWRIDAARASDDEKVTAHTRQATDEAGRRLVGRRITVCVGPHGETVVDVPVPTDLLEARLLGEVERVLALELAPPLPRVPVGRGASWKARALRPLALAAQVEYASLLTLSDFDDDGFDLAVATTLSAAPQPAPPTPGVAVPVVIDEVEGSLGGRIVRLTREATPVYSDLDLEAIMSLTEVAATGSEPTEAERKRGYKLVVRSREAMQADTLGPLSPLNWDEPQ
jgi:hypothetical protein